MGNKKVAKHIPPLTTILSPLHLLYVNQLATLGKIMQHLIFYRLCSRAYNIYGDYNKLAI